MGLPPGRVVLRRQFQRADLLSRVWLGHVVADDARGLAMWVRTGSPYRDIAAADGRDFRDVPFADWNRTSKVLRALTWRGDVLMLHPPDEPYSVWFFFAPDGAFRSWYVNLEVPGARWEDGPVAGIDTVDHDLDIVVQPDRTWRWKDEAEFAEHLAHPDTYWVDDADAVWSAGRRALERIEAGAHPFDDSFTRTRPDPSWSAAELPPGWDRPRARGRNGRTGDSGPAGS
jgi:hypothetical protein